MTNLEFLQVTGQQAPANATADWLNAQYVPPTQQSAPPAPNIPPANNVPPVGNVPPALNVPPAAAPVAAPQNNANRWPSVFLAIDDLRLEGGQILDLHSPVADPRTNLPKERALIHIKYNGVWLQGIAYCSSKKDANGNVIGFHPISECSQLCISQDPSMPGRYNFLLTPTGLDASILAKATIAVTAKGVDWPAFMRGIQDATKA